MKQTRGSQEPVIAHLADSCQDKEHIKAIRSNILSKFGSNWASSSKRTEYFNESPIGWFVKLSLDVAAILVGGVIGYNGERHPPSDHSPKFGLNWITYSRKKNIYNEILIGSYVKLSLAEGAILVGKWGQQMQFWK